MRALFLAALALISTVELHAAGQPVTLNELCLLLRGGYTSEEVARQVAGRPLLEPLNADGEAALSRAGANAALVSSLKTTSRALSPAEAEAARQRQADIDRRNLASQATAQATLAAAQKAAEASDRPHSQHMADLLRGKLVSMRDGQLHPYNDSELNKKRLFALYFSASWCGPCRRFTPSLVDFYKQFASAHPEFEVVFISNDRTEADMQNYMRQDGMAWAALAFDRRKLEPELTHYAGSGIPDLIIVDSSGQVLADSYRGEEYLGPQNPLAKLRAKFEKAGS